MGELSPVIEGATKFREGKKWKNRYVRVTRLSPVADSLTLQLWRDEREVERGLSPTKGSINLTDYVGSESLFNLDKESHTIGFIFKDVVIILAFESHENLIKWQVRLCNQFEEGIAMPVHLVTSPKKSKLSTGPMKIHLQNLKFSLSSGTPPALIHSWNMVDLRRFGAIEGGRFCFEGGTRCGKGEGLHVFRVDNPEDIQINFELASKGKLENKRRGAVAGYSMSTSPSVSSNLCSESSYNGLHSNGSFRSSEELERSRSQSRTRSINNSFAGWPSLEAGLAMSSPETLSLTLSDMEVSVPGSERISSPIHLVSRRAVLEKMCHKSGESSNGEMIGYHASSRSYGSEDEFNSRWAVEKGQRGLDSSHQAACQRSIRRGGLDQLSIDGLSLSSGESAYDHPKTVLKVTSSPKARNSTSSSTQRSNSSSLGRKSLPQLQQQLSVSSSSSNHSGQIIDQEMRKLIAATPCACDKVTAQGCSTLNSTSKIKVDMNGKTGYENYDMPRNLGKKEAMQFYDTPRNVREAIESSQFTGPLANYDIPTAGALPVFRKPCGCIMKLVSHGGQECLESLPSNDHVMRWTCLREDEGREHVAQMNDLKIPRVKLTGHGRMPVVDMSKVNARNSSSRNTTLERGTSNAIMKNNEVTHPVYAQIDKSKKSETVSRQGYIQSEEQFNSTGCTQIQTDQPNYTNIDFANSLTLYENSRDVLSRVQSLNQNDIRENRPIQVVQQTSCGSEDETSLEMNPSEQTTKNYLDMSSKHETHHMNGYEEMKYTQSTNQSPESMLSPLRESTENIVLMGDSKYDTIKQMPKQANKDICMNVDSKSNIPTVRENSVLQSSSCYSGYVTMPRKGSKNITRETTDVSNNRSRERNDGQNKVKLRRCASVPSNRDSTSSGSSDSGVSTSSPRQSLSDQSEFQI